MTEVCRHVALRPATSDDADDLLAWRNERETRMNSRTASVIPADVHRAWLERVLASRDTQLFIATVENGAAVGMGRLDRRGDECDVAEVSIAVAPGFRGLRLGVEIVEALVVEAMRGSGLKALVAECWAENAASLITFLKARFIPFKMREEGGRSWVLLARRLGEHTSPVSAEILGSADLLRKVPCSQK